MKRSRIALIVVSHLLLASCSGASNGDAGSAADEIEGYLFPWELAVDEEAMEQELDRLLQEFRDSEVLFTECVRAEGFDYVGRTIEQEAVTSDLELLTQADQLQEFGYGIVRGEGNGGLNLFIDGGTVPFGEMAEFDEYLQTEGDCFDLRYNNDIQFQVAELQGSVSYIPERVLADPDFIDAQGNWVECMAERGFNYRNPSEAFNDIESSLIKLDPNTEDYLDKLDALGEFEVEVATSDLECFVTEVDPVLRQLIISD